MEVTIPTVRVVLAALEARVVLVVVAALSRPFSAPLLLTVTHSLLLLPPQLWVAALAVRVVMMTVAPLHLLPSPPRTLLAPSHLRRTMPQALHHLLPKTLQQPLPVLLDPPPLLQLALWAQLVML